LPETKSKTEHVKTFENLDQNKTYYWKVIALNPIGFETETKVESFITSNF